MTKAEPEIDAKGVLRPLVQAAPYPEELELLVNLLEYKEGWSFSLREVDRGQESVGLTLCILIVTRDSYDHSKKRSVMHYMPVPPASYNRQSWQRWLFDQCLLVDRHEGMEEFTIDGEKPYAPNHGPGWDPYIITDLTTDVDRRTSFRGDVKD